MRRALLSIALLAGLACAEDYSILMSPTFPDAAATATEMSSSAWATDSAKKVAAASLDAIHIGAGQQAPTWDSAIAIVRARNRAAVIFVDTNVLTSSGGSLPNVPITVFGNQATLTLNGNTTVTGNYSAENLNVVASTGDTLKYVGATGSETFELRGGSRKGAVVVSSGRLSLDHCTQTWGITSDVLSITGTGQLIEIGSINTLPIVQSSATSVIYIENCTWNTSRNGYLISSTAGQLSVANTVIVNGYASTGGGISISNAATSSAPNILSGVFIASAIGVTNTSGVTVYSKVSSSGTNTLTYCVPAMDLLGNSLVSGPFFLVTTPASTAQSLGLTSTYSQTATAAITYTIQAAAVAAGGKWCIHSQNVATTITTSLGTAIVYHGAAGATSVTIPATQSLINVECDGSKCYIN